MTSRPWAYKISAMDFSANVGNAVRRRRLGKSMTATELGDLVGKTNQCIGQYELGRRRISQQMLYVIAAALGTRPSHIIREAEGEVGG